MAYESRIFVVNVHRRPEIPAYSYAEKIAMVNMCAMDSHEWLDLFKTDIDYKLFMDDGNTEFDTDCYGQHLRSAAIEDVIAFLEKQMQHDTYRRLPVLYGLLKGFAKEAWQNIEIVHFGY